MSVNDNYTREKNEVLYSVFERIASYQGIDEACTVTRQLITKFGLPFPPDHVHHYTKCYLREAKVITPLHSTSDSREVRREIAALFGRHVVKENPHSRVDYADPEVVKLADFSIADLLKTHNGGHDTNTIALLLEIADEEGWS